MIFRIFFAILAANLCWCEVLPSPEVQAKIVAACKRGQSLDALRVAIDDAKREANGANIDFCFKTSSSDETFPLCLVSDGHKAQLLVEAGAVLECPNADKDLDYPLIHAITARKALSRFSYYLSLGASLNPGNYNVIYHLCAPFVQNSRIYDKMLELALYNWPEAKQLVSSRKPGGTTPLGRLLKENPEDRILPDIHTRIQILLEAGTDCFVPLREHEPRTIFEELLETFKTSPLHCQSIFRPLFLLQRPPQDLDVVALINERVESTFVRTIIMDEYDRAEAFRADIYGESEKHLIFSEFLLSIGLQDLSGAIRQQMGNLF